MEVVKMDLSKLIIIFIGYLVIHILIGLFLTNRKKILEQKKDDKELIGQVKILTIIFRLFPAIIVILLLFYFST